MGHVISVRGEERQCQEDHLFFCTIFSLSWSVSVGMVLVGGVVHALF